MKRPRRNPAPGFKAKVALAALKGSLLDAVDGEHEEAADQDLAEDGQDHDRQEKAAEEPESVVDPGSPGAEGACVSR